MGDSGKQEALGMSLDDLIKKQHQNKKGSSSGGGGGGSGSSKGGRNRGKSSRGEGGREAMKTEQVFRVRNEGGAHKRRGDARRGHRDNEYDRDRYDDRRDRRGGGRDRDRDIGRPYGGGHREGHHENHYGGPRAPPPAFDPYAMMSMMTQFMGAGRGRGRGRGRGGRGGRGGGRGRGGGPRGSKSDNKFSKDGLNRLTCATNAEGVLGVAFDGTNVVLIAPNGDVSISLIRSLSESDTHLMFNALNWTLHAIGIELVVKDLAAGELQVKAGRSLLRYTDGMVVEAKGDTKRAEAVMKAVEDGKKSDENVATDATATMS